MNAASERRELAIRQARDTIFQYKGELTAALPSHLTEKGMGWLAAALGALRRNEGVLQAANNDPASLVVALSQAAQLGLMPGSDEYYLTVKGGKILGITGYQGEVELMYRAGAVSSVIAEIVYENDKFEYVPGVHDKPIHHFDHFGDRGKIRGAYAYAIMKDGAVSKVVIADQARINRAMDASASANASHSPWKSDYGAMVLKTAAHDLAKWVPTSAEYRNAQIRAEQESKTPAAPAKVEDANAARQAQQQQAPAPAPQQEQVPDSDGVLEDLGEQDNEPNYPENWGQPE
jgi:recombination protein RecT